jgi:hypothetical protein
MTDIPGTGKLASSELPPEIPTITLNTVNINELKKPKEVATGQTSRYDSIYAFLIIGIVIGLVFLIISLKYSAFLIFVPLGPSATISVWYVRKFMKRLDQKPTRIK